MGSDKRGSELTKLHNEGEQDYTDRKYNPPTKDPLTFMIEGYSKEELEDIEAYKSGYDNAKKQDSGSGCFLTTACLQHAGLDEDCYELNLLRSFRDGFVANLPNGPGLLTEYYAQAPEIVARIQCSSDRHFIFSEIYAVVRRAVGLIEEQRCTEAIECYRALFEQLKRRYISPQ